MSPTPSGEITPGTTAEVEPANPQKTAAAVRLSQKRVVDDVVVRLKSITSNNAKGVGPGEVSGPALVVTVELHNTSTRAVNVDYVIVNLLDAKGQVGSPLTSDPSDPFSGSIAPGKSAEGVYVFSVGLKARSPIKVSVAYSPKHATALFVGNAK